jgi:hypothetical protein
MPFVAVTTENIKESELISLFLSRELKKLYAKTLFMKDFVEVEFFDMLHPDIRYTFQGGLTFKFSEIIQWKLVLNEQFKVNWKTKQAMENTFLGRLKNNLDKLKK